MVLRAGVAASAASARTEAKTARRFCPRNALIRFKTPSQAEAGRSRARSIGWFRALLAIFSACALSCGAAAAQQPDISLPAVDPVAPIVITSPEAQHWRQGETDVWLFGGGGEIRQDSRRIAADQIVVWADLNDLDQVKRLVVYCEGHAVVAWSPDGQTAGNRIEDETWIGRLSTTGLLDVQAPLMQGNASAPPAILARAEAAHASPLLTQVATESHSADSAVHHVPPKRNPVAEPTVSPPVAGSMMISPQTGAVLPSPQQAAPPVSQAPPPPPNAGPPPVTRVEIFSRQSSVPLNLKTIPSDVPGEQVLVASGGVRIAIDSQALAQRPELAGAARRVFILADNVVAWSNALDPANPAPDQARWEVYLEGNVVFSAGNRTIYAERMYYDATYRRGTILRAEFFTPAQAYQGLVRLKADVLQQLDENSFQAFGAAVTSSRLGVPRYWLQSDQLSVEGSPTADIDPVTGAVAIDPTTGYASTRDEFFVESRGNRVYLADVPVFYWPSFRTSLDDPRFYVESIEVGDDRIFGTQVRTRVDMYQLLGYRRRPPGTNWTGALDILSERGVGLGSDFDYRLNSLFGIPGQAEGRYRSWFIRDSGLDFLGADRLGIPLEEDQRGMVFLNHRQRFRPGFQLKAEIGYLSDRNFLEQYYQQEWDWDKDFTTGLQLEWLYGNQSFDLWGQGRLNDFFTQTTWAPRFDHHILGQSLLADRLVYFAHSHVGYARFDVADPPTNPIDLLKFDPLAWETAEARGVRGGTRHELDLPFNLGPFKLVPYVLGDATYWQQDLDGNDLLRTYGQTGLRTSLPFWRVDPSIHSLLFNVNGLAHKVTFDAELAYADANQDFDRLPLYDPLDDDAQEFFRRRFAFDTFGIVPGMDVPIRFDERDFARRYGLQGDVSSPSAEIADDLLFVRLGARNRWQTKRGLPGRERIVDWISLDSGVTIFPKADRDNLGEEVGLLNYDFRWFLGDRLSLVSDGFADFFSQGLKTVSAGAEISRPGVGDVYVGVRSIEGPISANVLLARMSYRMSDKWGIQGLSSYDIGATGNIGQRVAAVYIGESFLFQFGVNYDVSRDNVGFLFGVEPRFMARPQLFRPGGSALPPASAEFLE
jgi:hypothetical protein